MILVDTSIVIDYLRGKIPPPALHEHVDDVPPPTGPSGPPIAPDAATVASASVSEEVPEAMRSGSGNGPAAAAAPNLPAYRGGGDPDFDVEADLRAQPPDVQVDLDEPLYTADDAEEAVKHFDAVDYGEERDVAPGVHATWFDAGHILGSAMIRVRVEAATGGGPGPSSETTTGRRWW